MNNDETGGMPCHGGPVENTDRHLWPLVSDAEDYYAPSIHVTKDGGLGINVAGLVFVRTIRQWHELAKNATERINKEEARKLLDAYDNEVFELRATGFVSPHYLSTVQSVLDAMTLPAETIAEHQREIARLKVELKSRARHYIGCRKLSPQITSTTCAPCTCGLDEVLR